METISPKNRRDRAPGKVRSLLGSWPRMAPLRLARFGAMYLSGWELRGVGLNLTRRCNLTCRYCRIVDNSPERRRKELTPEQWLQIIDRLVSHRRAHFIFTGGEPLLYDGVFRLVDHASGRALTSMITNATLLDQACFDRLDNLDFLTFSFDTLDAGRSSLPKDPSARLGLIAEQCRRQRITPSAIVVVSAKNYTEVEDIVRLLDAHGISALLSMIHSGGGEWDFRHHAPDLEFSTEEDLRGLEALQRRLLEMKRAGVRIAESDTYLSNMAAFARGTFRIRCPAAQPFLTVDLDGRIKACHDTPASALNALTFTDYDAMLRQVRSTVHAGCNCYYDCYVEGQASRLRDAVRVLRR